MSLSITHILKQACTVAESHHGVGSKQVLPLGRSPICLVALCLLLMSGVWMTALGQDGKKPDKETPRTEEINKLIGQLGSNQPAERKAASEALEKIGEPALPELREALKNDDKEIQRAARELIDTIERQLAKEARVVIEKAGGSIWHSNDDELGITLGNKTIDTDLRLIRYLGNVGVVSLGDAAITDVGLLHLKGMRTVTTLDIGPLRRGGLGTKITDEGLRVLKTMPKLRRLRLSGNTLTDAGLVYLRDLPDLDTLELVGNKFTDKGLADLAHLPRLQELSLVRTQITGDGLKYLKDADKLETLTLKESTAVTDAGLASLKHLKYLVSLNLSETPITDATLAHVEHLRSLKVLTLQRTKITGPGLVHLKGLEQLEELNLLLTPVTDDGASSFKALQALKNLKEVSLEWTNVTDAAVVHLKGLASVKILNLNGSEVTPQGLAKLRKAIPNSIVSNGSPRKNGRLVVTDFVWVGQGKDGRWTNPKNWKVDGVPPEYTETRGYPGQDDVATDCAIIQQQDHTAITLDQAITLSSLKLHSLFTGSLTVKGKCLTVSRAKDHEGGGVFVLKVGALHLIDGAMLDLNNVLALWSGGTINATSGKKYQSATIYVNHGSIFNIEGGAAQLGANLGIGSSPKPNSLETPGVVHIGELGSWKGPAAPQAKQTVIGLTSNVTLFNNASITVGTKGELYFNQDQKSDKAGGIVVDAKGASKESRITNNGIIYRRIADEEGKVLTIDVPVVQESASAVTVFGPGTKVDFAGGFEVKAGELRGIKSATVTGIKHPLPRNIKTSLRAKCVMDDAASVVTSRGNMMSWEISLNTGVLGPFIPENLCRHLL